MNAITQFLLAGAALGALATAPALAGDAPHFRVMALHAGHAVNKTSFRDPSRQHLTYTFGASTYVPASDLRKKTKLPDTYYRWSTYFSCSATMAMQQTLRVPKRSTYAKLGKATETYSQGCSFGPTVFYGDTYELINQAGEGKTDSFVSTLIGKWTERLTGVKYKGTMHLDVSVAIGK